MTLGSLSVFLGFHLSIRKMGSVIPIYVAYGCERYSFQEASFFCGEHREKVVWRFLHLICISKKIFSTRRYTVVLLFQFDFPKELVFLEELGLHNLSSDIRGSWAGGL